MASITACFARVAKTLTQQEREQILTPLREEFMAAHAAALAGGATDPRASALRILDRMLGADAPADARKNAENAAAAPVAESLAPGRSADGDAGVATSQGGGSAATHADPGQPAEPATKAVVAESLQKAAKREQLTPKQMMAEALKLIDEAIARAPDNKDEAKTAPAKATIAVPGDGTFKVVNTKERLREFRALVEKSPGFTGKNAKPRVEKAVTSGDLSPASLAREMLDDGEPLNAIEVLDAAGKPLRFGTSAEKDPIVYTDSSTVEVGGMGGFFVGRYWARDKKSAAAKQMAGWAVIDEASGLAAGRGVDKNAALAVAALNVKKPENVKRVEEARQQAEPGLQDAMRAKFREWAEKQQQATFAEQDRIQAHQGAFAAKERERDAFYKSIMGEEAKRPQITPTSTGWKPDEVKAFLSAAEKAGKAGEAVEFVRDVLSTSALDAWGTKAISEWEKANTNTFLSTEFGQPIDLKKPPHTVTWDFIEPTVRANRYIAPGARGDAEMSRWKMAHFEAVKAALARGWKVPDKVLYDNARLLRDDLNDDAADLASDAMVTTYQQTKDYGKAVQAYRDWKPGVDLKGFEETKDRGNFRLDDDDITVLVERTKTWDGKDRYQARLKNSTNASGPNLTKQQAIDWAANLRDDMRKTQAPVSSREGQMNLAARGSRIASLKAMNDRLRQIAPDQAWADSNIEGASNAELDRLQDQISAALVDAQRGPAPVNPLRAELESMSGAELRDLMGRMGLAGKLMTAGKRVDALLAEDPAEVRAAMQQATPAQGESTAEVARREEFRNRIQAYWDGTATPAIRDYLRAFDAFGVDRLERNRVKPAGMSAREWLESYVARQSTWDGGRKTGLTGIQALSQKDLWPTEDGSGERLRKAMLEAVKALKNAPSTSSKLMADAFMEPQAAAQPEPAKQVEAPPTDGDIKTRADDAGNVMMFRIDATDLPADTAAAYAAAPAEADQRAVKRLQLRLARYIPGVRLDAVAAAGGRAAGEPLQGADRSRVAAAELLRALTGRRAVFFTAHRTNFLNGVHTSTEPNLLFLRADASRPHMAVMGHEFLHGLRADRPDLYEALRDRIRLVAPGRAAYAADLESRRQRSGLERIDDDKVEEEFIADVMGDSWMDAGFWRDLAGKEPAGPLRKAFLAAFRFISDVLGKLADMNPFGSDVYLSDVRAARRAMAQALREYVEVESVGAPEMAGDSFSTDERAPWYSALERAIAAQPMRGGGASAWDNAVKGLLASGKVKADEVEWSGLRDWLAMQPGIITKAAVQQYLQANGVQVQETVLGGGDAFADLEKAIVEADALGFTFARDVFEDGDEYTGRAIQFTRRRDGVTFGWNGRNFVIDDYPSNMKEEDIDPPQDALIDVARDIKALSETEREGNDADGTRYSQYTLPGGTNYRELLLTLPASDKGVPALEQEKQEQMLVLIHNFEQASGRPRHEAVEIAQAARNGTQRFVAMLQQAMGAERADALLKQARDAKDAYDKAFKERHAAIYKSNHWDQPNVLAHIRLNDRTDADGKRVLFVEEIQSDWQQAARRKGFSGPHKAGDKISVMQNGEMVEVTVIKDTDANGLTYAERADGSRFNVNAKDGVPRAPFVDKTDKWVALALKRIIKMAVDEGYDRVAMVTGEQSAERYDLSKQVDAVRVTKRDDGTFQLSAKHRGSNGYAALGPLGIEAKNLPDYIGKDLADKALRDAEADGSKNFTKAYTGLDLKIGGEGMRAFYDKIVPSVLKDVLRKVGGGPIGQVSIGEAGAFDKFDGLQDGRVEHTFDTRAAAERWARLDADREVRPVNAKPQPGFDITPAMREAAAGGMPMFSIAVDGLQSNDTARRLAERAMDVIRSDSTIGVLGRTVGTPYHLAHAKNADGSLRNPDLRRVYDEAQDYLNDINTFANDPAELAPGVVPMLNKWSDARNPLRLAGEKRARLARALFEGTLGWTRDDQGNPVESDDARGAGIEWTATELKQRYGFDDADVKLYQQARAAIARSLDFMAAAEVARQMGGRDLPEGLRAMVSRGDTGRFKGLVTNFLAQQVDGAQFALRMLKTEHREQLAAITGPEADARRAALKAKQAIALEVAQERLDKWQGLQRGVAKVYDRVTDLKDRGYMPLMRFGPHTVTVRDLDTKEVVFFGMYETQAEANVEARRLRESAAPNETVTRGEMSQEQWKLFKGVSPETVELFGQVAGVERTPVFEEYIRRTKANHSALKRLIQRKGTPGFSEDVQRVLAAFLTSNARAAAANLHAGAMEEATLAIDQERGLVKDYATRLTQYVQNPTDEAQGIRGLMFIQFIGGSVASALVNMTQPFTMTLPYLSQHGGPGAASRLLTAGMRKALTKIDPQSPLGVAMQRAEKDGIVSPQALHELQGQAVNRFGRIESGLRSLGVSTRAAEAIDSNLRRVLFAWGGFFSLAEQFNRRATFIAAYELAIERGMPDPFGFAEEAVKETQGVYNRCVDLETEMLTAAGWKRMADLVEGEAVYGLDADGRLVHDVLQAVHTYPGSQQVTELRNSNGLSIVATGHHDHLVQNYSSRDGKWQRLRKVRTKDLKNAHHLLRVPLGDATGRTPIYTDDEVALFAWVATEGHLFAHRGVTEKRGVGLVQSQRHNPHYVAEIDALLDRLGGHYNRKTARNGEMVCWQLRKPLWLKIHAALPGKVVTPALVASLTIPQMRLFIDTFTKGDGHFPEEGGNTITQRLRENLDALQAMAVLSGITSTVYYQVGAHDFGSIYLAKNSVRSHVKAMVESAERTVDTVWCPQTGSGCWIARRNGRTFVTGNSNRPQWARGPVGATVMTFKQFSISYLEFLSRLPRREKAIALGVLTLAAGLEGLPFADDLDDLIDTIMQRLFGKAFSAKRAKVEALTAMGMSRDSAEWVLRGASALPGFPVDLAGRMSLGNMIPGTGVLRTDGAKDKSAEVLEALGPAGGVVRDALRGEFSPVAVRNAVKGAEMFRTGQYRDELGRKVADVDGADAAAKALGFQPREIARESRGSRMAQSVVAQTRAAESDIVRLWAQGIADNEPDKVAEARAQLEAWNQRNPEARIAINRMQIARQVRDMRATREERLIRATPKELRGRVAQELQQ